MPIQFEHMNNLYELYRDYWVVLGEVLTEMEKNGIYVDKSQMEYILQ